MKSRNSWILSLLPHFLMSIAILGIHLVLLYKTTFILWPEMFMFPFLIEKGLVPYKDFVIMYTPLSPYFLSFFRWIFGYAIESTKVTGYLLIGVADLLLYGLLYRYTKSLLITGVICLAYVVWHVALEGNMVWVETLYIPLLLMGLYQFYRYIETMVLRNLLLSSLMLAVASMIKQSVAAVLLVAGVWICYRERKSLRGMIRALLMLVFPTIFLYFLGYIYFFLQGTGTEYLYWTMIFPLSVSSTNSYYQLRPPLQDMLLLGPLYGGVVVLTVFTACISRYKTIPILSLLCISWTVGCMVTVIPRWGIFHVLPSLPFVLLGYAVILRHIVEIAKRRNVLLWHVILVGCICIAQLGSLWYLYSNRISHTEEFLSSYRRTYIESLKEQIRDASLFVFGDDEYVFYFLDQAPAVRPWMQLVPGYAEIPGVQEKMVHELETKRIAYVLYSPYHVDKRYYDDYFPDTLGAYIFQKYAYADEQPLAPESWILYRKK